MCRSYQPPDWPIVVLSLLLVFIIIITGSIEQKRKQLREAEQRTEPQIVEDPDPDTAEDALPQIYVTG